MIKGQLILLGAALALAGCVGLEPAGRNADRAPRPPAEQAPTPLPSEVVAAPNVTVAPTPTPEPARGESRGDVVVPGQVERQVPPPGGDPRSASQRLEDIRSWDQCVSTAQSAFERDPMRPQLQSPEEACAQALGMADRNAAPESRRRR